MDFSDPLMAQTMDATKMSLRAAKEMDDAEDAHRLAAAAAYAARNAEDAAYERLLDASTIGAVALHAQHQKSLETRQADEALRTTGVILAAKRLRRDQTAQFLEYARGDFSQSMLPKPSVDREDLHVPSAAERVAYKLITAQTEVDDAASALKAIE